MSLRVERCLQHRGEMVLEPDRLSSGPQDKIITEVRRDPTEDPVGLNTMTKWMSLAKQQDVVPTKRAMGELISLIDIPNVRMGMAQVILRAADMAKGWRDAAAQNRNSAKLPKDVLPSRGLQVWEDVILTKTVIGLTEDLPLEASEAEVRAA
ncbi:MAG: hypothetical protein Q9180_007939 [Flavoplaca navasiana]